MFDLIAFGIIFAKLFIFIKLTVVSSIKSNSIVYFAPNEYMI